MASTIDKLDDLFATSKVIPIRWLVCEVQSDISNHYCSVRYWHNHTYVVLAMVNDRVFIVCNTQWEFSCSTVMNPLRLILVLLLGWWLWEQGGTHT